MESEVSNAAVLVTYMWPTFSVLVGHMYVTTAVSPPLDFQLDIILHQASWCHLCLNKIIILDLRVNLKHM